MTDSLIDIFAQPDVLDTRDVLDRMDTLAEALSGFFLGDTEDHAALARWCVGKIENDVDFPLFDEADEFRLLHAMLAEVRDYAGDEPEDGVSLIRESHLQTYFRELCEELGDVPQTLPWWLVIDWAATCENLKADYTSVELVGTTYWFR